MMVSCHIYKYGYVYVLVSLSTLLPSFLVVNGDADVCGRLKVVFLENYRVTLAEKGNFHFDIVGWSGSFFVPVAGSVT
jgi:hypothetical protein